MTMYAAMDPPQRIDETLLIFCVTGGWARGPKIDATVIQPAADWISALPNGSSRIDVRLTLKTNDGALIYVSYNGVIRTLKSLASACWGARLIPRMIAMA